MTEYQVTYQGIVHDQQGYARASRGYILGLDNAGVDIRVEPLNFGTPSAKLELEVVDKLKKLIAKPRNLSKKQILVYHAQPYGIDAREYRKVHGYDKVIINTVWETTKIPDSWFPFVNFADAIIVPSTQNVEALRNSGVTVPIFRVGHGSDIVRFAPDNEPIDVLDLKGLDNTFKFLSIFQWQHRKAPDLLLQAFWNEFTEDDDVALILKTNAGGGTTKQQQRQIVHTVFGYKNMVAKHKTADVILSTSLFSDNDLRGLYTFSDVYVQPSRGEGVGLPFIEAMSSGIPCIATGWGGQTDFLNDSNGYQIKYEMESPKLRERQAIATTFSDLFTNDMKWAEADVEHLQKLMRHAYENREEVKKKGSKAREDMEGMTWNHIGSIFKQSIEKVL
jgi:glycosyltransferase involved in cell wall biosynthesis